MGQDCSIKITVKVFQDSSVGFGFTFMGLNDTEFPPNTFLWSLTDPNGVVINGRYKESETPDTTTWILLEGLDLADSVNSTLRYITIEGTYDESLDDVPHLGVTYKEQYDFDICKIIVPIAP